MPASTPVVSFGPPVGVSVATLGINPSRSEFLASDGRLLNGSKRRLATYESLSVSQTGELTDAAAIAIVNDCAAYFQRRPYRWFNPLDEILRQALDVSFYDYSACHLDLVQWATDPVWGQLSPKARQRLLHDDLPFLRRQLKAPELELVCVNGRTVIEWTQRTGLVRWTEVGRLDGPPAARLCVGDGEGATFVGWTCNLQSQHGARRHVDAIVDHVSAVAGGSIGARSRERAMDRGAHFGSGAMLVARLRQWLRESDDETLGDTQFGRAPWVSVDTPLGKMVLNADTKREAIADYLERLDRIGFPRTLHVVANRSGRVNKVVFAPTDRPPHGWYAYLTDELDEPSSFELS